MDIKTKIAAESSRLFVYSAVDCRDEFEEVRSFLYFLFVGYVRLGFRPFDRVAARGHQQTNEEAIFVLFCDCVCAARALCSLRFIIYIYITASVCVDEHVLLCVYRTSYIFE